MRDLIVDAPRPPPNKDGEVDLDVPTYQLLDRREQFPYGLARRQLHRSPRRGFKASASQHRGPVDDHGDSGTLRNRLADKKPLSIMSDAELIEDGFDRDLGLKKHMRHAGLDG